MGRAVPRLTVYIIQVFVAVTKFISFLVRLLVLLVLTVKPHLSQYGWSVFRCFIDRFLHLSVLNKELEFYDKIYVNIDYIYFVPIDTESQVETL